MSSEFEDGPAVAARIGFGSRPALVVVDLINAFTDPESPVGSDLDAVVEAIRNLLAVARAHDIPRVFTAISYEASLQDAGVWPLKSRVLHVFREGSPAVDVDERLARRDDETLIIKKGASAFFGTNLVSLLAAWRVDTVIVAGTSTSGCVRATVVDALQYGYRPIVPLECVGDRATRPHEASLFDIDAKYGDVVHLEAVLAYLGRYVK